MNKRYHPRKDIDPIEVQGLIAIKDLRPIADLGQIVEASASGFRVLLKRDDLCDKSLKKNLELTAIEGMEVSIFIPSMDLDMTGLVTRTRHIGNGVFEVGIDYTSDAPLYWRECLCDLLPQPGELTG
jgi:hypothetical protein